VVFLPDAHRTVVLDTVVGHVAGQMPVLTGAIDMTTVRVLDHVRVAVAAGVDGIVATAPFHARTHPAEIDVHVGTIAGRAGVPVYARVEQERLLHLFDLVTVCGSRMGVSSSALGAVKVGKYLAAAGLV
jgi:hypothetical protein